MAMEESWPRSEYRLRSEVVDARLLIPDKGGYRFIMIIICIIDLMHYLLEYWMQIPFHMMKGQ